MLISCFNIAVWFGRSLFEIQFNSSNSIYFHLKVLEVNLDVSISLLGYRGINLIYSIPLVTEYLFI